MERLCYFIAAVLCLVSCKKDPISPPDYCGDAIEVFKDHISYEGLIYFCNAQPPQQSFIPGVATATFMDSSTVIFHLSSDSINFDTQLIYNIHCAILEDVFPSISLDGQTDYDSGYFLYANFREDFTGSISLSFGFPNCLDNTAFEGLSK